MLQTSEARMVNKRWVGWETICCLVVSFPFQILLYILIPLPSHLPLFLFPLFQMPWCSQNISLSVTLFFHLHPHSLFPPIPPSCSTLTYAWSTSGEVQVFLIPLLCFSLYKGSKFEQLLHGIESCKGNFKIRLNGSGRWGLVEGIYCSLLLQWYLRVEQRRETPIFYYVHFTCQNRKTTGLINNINRGSVALIVPVSHSSEPACIIGPFHRRHFDLS